MKSANFSSADSKKLPMIAKKGSLENIHENFKCRTFEFKKTWGYFGTLGCLIFQIGLLILDHCAWSNGEGVSKDAFHILIDAKAIY